MDLYYNIKKHNWTQFREVKASVLEHNFKRWKWHSSKYYWIKKHIEPFNIETLNCTILQEGEFITWHDSFIHQALTVVNSYLSLLIYMTRGEKLSKSLLVLHNIRYGEKKWKMDYKFHNSHSSCIQTHLSGNRTSEIVMTWWCNIT